MDKKNKTISRPEDLPQDIKTGFIGGTGVYKLKTGELKKIDEVYPETPWGFPSSPITIAQLKEQKIAFLARHGIGHSIIPTEVPSRANICALKWLGVEQIIAFSAVGSLKEEIKPMDFVLPSSIIDRTFLRRQSFFKSGMVGHISFGDPFCLSLADIIHSLDYKSLNIDVHINETLICMEGPAFSTRAESKLYKSWGAGVINMSVIPEAKLAREAEICYQMICMSTDYDSWRDESEAVTVDEILKVIKENSSNAQKVIMAVLEKIPTLEKKCGCNSAAKFALITAPSERDLDVVQKIAQVLPNYF